MIFSLEMKLLSTWTYKQKVLRENKNYNLHTVQAIYGCWICSFVFV